MDDILAHFAQLTSVSPELSQAIQQRIHQHSVKKGTFLHQAGSVCTRTYWIRTGVIRLYYLKDGREVTDFFSSENQWITSADSFMTNQVDQCYLQAIDDSDVFALTNHDLHWLFTHFPEMERFGRIVMSQLFIQQSERLNSLRFTSAAERYQYFCASHRPILNRLPLGMVASYLGITQETLSRVRAAF